MRYLLICLTKISIKNKTIIIKVTSNRLKNKYAFNSMETLSNNYNFKIVRVYGASGHGKDLIDTMSSFDVKSILCCDVVSLDQ